MYTDINFFKKKCTTLNGKGDFLGLVHSYIALRNIESHRAIIRAIAVIDACYQNTYRDTSLFLDELPGSGNVIAVISKWLAEYPIPNTEAISGRSARCPYESIKNAHDAKRYVVTTLPYVREQSIFSIQEYAHRIVGIAHYCQDIYRDPELAEVFDIAADLERGDTEEGARRTGIDKIAMLVSRADTRPY